MPTSSSGPAIQEANAALKATQADQPSKGERAFNKIGKAALKVNGICESLASNEGAADSYQLLKDQVSNFAQNSKILMDALDEVGKMHLFIQVAVALFKTGLTLELARQGNEEKVLALNVTMSDMMRVLLVLEDIQDPNLPSLNSPTIAKRLEERMTLVAISIKGCAKLCDSYKKRHTALKFLTSLKWQAKFTDVAQEFANHKAAIQFELQIHAAAGITTVNSTLNAMSTDFANLNKNLGKMMETVFKRMQSPEEHEVESLVSSRGFSAEKALENDKLLEQMLAIGKSKDVKRIKRPGDVEEDKTMTVIQLRAEVTKDVEEVIASNKYFEQKFEVVWMQVKDLKETMKRESDRVIGAILKGPQDMILDPDIYHVWNSMGWKGSVKAKHLVMALQDHFANGSRATLAAIRDITSNRGDTSDSKMVDEITGLANRPDPNVLPSDQWALEYITVHRVQPLIEALDVDASTFVSVNEVNAFTDARPSDWSLPHWIAYWTYGFEMTVQWYFRRIRKVYAEIYCASNAALPSNLRPISRFFSSWQVRFTEDMLSGLRDVELWDDVFWDDHPVFPRFKSYVEENEMRMERSLRTVKYYLDAANTLTIVAGEGRPEKFVLPLIFLLLRRALWIIKEARYVTLHDRELEVISDSLSPVIDAVHDRVRTLQAMHRLQNLNEKDQLKKFFYGLYRYAFEAAEIGPYWRRGLWTDMYSSWIHEEDTPNGLSTEGPLPLFYGPQIEEIHLLANQALADQVSACPPHVLRSPVGYWTGWFAYGDVNWGYAWFAITISSLEEDGGITGSGVDALGPFAVKGTLKGDQLNFSKEYATPRHGHGVVWQYQGTIDVEQDITGTVTWDRPPDDSENLPSVADDNAEETNEGAGQDESFTDEPVDGDTNVALTSETNDTPSGTTAKETPSPNGHHAPAADSDAPPATGDDPPPTPVGDNLPLTNDNNVSLAIANDTRLGEPSDPAAALHTFFLRRRPLEYLFVRPSPQEFAYDRPRALWKLALDYALTIVRGHALSSKTLLGRRRVFEFIGSEDQYYADSAKAQEWTELVKGIHEDDIYLQHCIKMLQYRRECNNLFECDCCTAKPYLEAAPFSRSRYTCLDCSKEQVDGSMDLCAGCCFADKSVVRNNIVHSPTHNILQFRTMRLRVYEHTLFSTATLALQEASKLAVSESHTSAPPSEPEAKQALCLECQKSIKGPPYWYCIECFDWSWQHVFVCSECNEQAEEKKAWLTQLAANPDYRNTHDWSHTLVYSPDPDVRGKPDEESRLSMEERLGHLQEEMDNRLCRLEEKIDGRLGKLEKLLDQLLSVGTQRIEGGDV